MKEKEVGIELFEKGKEVVLKTKLKGRRVYQIENGKEEKEGRGDCGERERKYCQGVEWSVALALRERERQAEVIRDTITTKLNFATRIYSRREKVGGWIGKREEGGCWVLGWWWISPRHSTPLFLLLSHFFLPASPSSLIPSLNLSI